VSNKQTQSQVDSDRGSVGQKMGSHPFWRIFRLSVLVHSLGYAWYSFCVPSNDVTWADDVIAAR
jgi:thioredoxin 1